MPKATVFVATIVFNGTFKFYLLGFEGDAPWSGITRGMPIFTRIVLGCVDESVRFGLEPDLSCGMLRRQLCRTKLPFAAASPTVTFCA